MQFDKLTIRSQEALQDAQSQAGARGHQNVEPAHLPPLVASRFFALSPGSLLSDCRPCSFPD